MFLSSLLRGMLQFATRRHIAPNEGPALPPVPAPVEPHGTVRGLPVMGRARVPFRNMPCAREVDGPTIRMVWPGQPGVNKGTSYVRPEGVIGRHRPPDTNVMPARFTRQQVA
ncbi:hypothetical protein ACGFIW_02045 [Micromonospora sp. NPDC048935]|uniref:hypothetical protein n=1 Tax=Micromonospora sp. NPDC048935 TaxID=3364262 RepID=UPI0037127233